MDSSAISSVGTNLAQVSAMTQAARHAPVQFTAAAMRNASPAEQRTAVAAQFEAILVRQLLGKTMNSMLGGSEGGVAGSVYGDMLADTFSQHLTAGHGLGLSRFIQQQLTPRGEKIGPVNDTSIANPASEIRPQAPAPHHS
jgi:Rod binding domain-containing protein